VLEELLALAMLEDRRRQLDRLVLVLHARGVIAPTSTRQSLRDRFGAWLRPAASVATLPRDVRLEQ
jgi:hypothetical protein